MKGFGEHHFKRGMDRNYIEISGQKKAETDRAILFFDGKKEAWIPKSQIESEEDEGKGIVTIIIAEWMAIEKELV